MLTRRQSAHAQKHGSSLGSDMRREDLAPAESEGGARHARPARIPATISGDQDDVEAYDVTPGPLWRDGLNLSASGDTLAQACARLLQEQLDEDGLTLSPVDSASGRGLESGRAFREGECVCASALFWDEDAVLNAWLSMAGHDKWTDRVVVVDGVKKFGVPRRIYAVLVGAVQYANSFHGIRRAPNCRLVFSPQKGFNEGALWPVPSLIALPRAGPRSFVLGRAPRWPAHPGLPRAAPKPLGACGLGRAPRWLAHPRLRCPGASPKSYGPGGLGRVPRWPPRAWLRTGGHLGVSSVAHGRISRSRRCVPLASFGAVGSRGAAVGASPRSSSAPDLDPCTLR